MTNGKNRGTLWRQQNPEKARKRARQYYKTHKQQVLQNNDRWKQNNPEYYLWHSAKQRAKQSNLDFSIDIEDIHIPNQCPVLQTKFIWKDKEYAASLDRIDNTKGYIKGNIQVISKKANRMKNNATLSELLLFSQWMMKHRTDLDDRWKPNV